MIRHLTVSMMALTVLAADADAQIRASERGTVTQTVDGTTIKIDYSRLQARGRDELFGGVVPWGEVWTGANWATTIAVDRDITINGHELPPGTYSVWFEVQPEEWTVILDPEPRRFHLFAPEESDDQVRFTIRPETGSHMEVLDLVVPGDTPDRDHAAHGMGNDQRDVRHPRPPFADGDRGGRLCRAVRGLVPFRARAAAGEQDRTV